MNTQTKWFILLIICLITVSYLLVSKENLISHPVTETPIGYVL